MQLIVEVAEGRARVDASLEWAGIAIRAAEIGAEENQGEHRHAFLYRAMLLRALFIAQLGSKPGDAILDPAIILHWFNQELKVTPAEARRNSERWKDPRFAAEFAAELEQGQSKDDPPRYPPHLAEALNELLELQLIKYRLQIIRRLAEAGELPPDPTINEWLQTAKYLP
jgi:hypothetical protein